MMAMTIFIGYSPPQLSRRSSTERSQWNDDRAGLPFAVSLRVQQSNGVPTRRQSPALPSRPESGTNAPLHRQRIGTLPRLVASNSNVQCVLRLIMTQYAQ